MSLILAVSKSAEGRDRRSTSKESRGNTSFCKFLQGIRLHAKSKNGANTSSIWSSQRNCYRYNDDLQKYESNC